MKNNKLNFKKGKFDSKPTIAISTTPQEICDKSNTPIAGEFHEVIFEIQKFWIPTEIYEDFMKLFMNSNIQWGDRKTTK